MSENISCSPPCLIVFLQQAGCLELSAGPKMFHHVTCVTPEGWQVQEEINVLSWEQRKSNYLKVSFPCMPLFPLCISWARGRLSSLVTFRGQVLRDPRFAMPPENGMWRWIVFSYIDWCIRQFRTWAVTTVHIGYCDYHPVTISDKHCTYKVDTVLIGYCDYHNIR